MDLTLSLYHKKELAEGRQFPSLGEITEKYITFLIPIEKEITSICKHGKEIAKSRS